MITLFLRIHLSINLLAICITLRCNCTIIRLGWRIGRVLTSHHLLKWPILLFVIRFTVIFLLWLLWLWQILLLQQFLPFNCTLTIRFLVIMQLFIYSINILLTFVHLNFGFINHLYLLGSVIVTIALLFFVCVGLLLFFLTRSRRCLNIGLILVLLLFLFFILLLFVLFFGWSDQLHLIETIQCHGLANFLWTIWLKYWRVQIKFRLNHLYLLLNRFWYHRIQRGVLDLELKLLKKMLRKHKNWRKVTYILCVLEKLHGIYLQIFFYWNLFWHLLSSCSHSIRQTILAHVVYSQRKFIIFQFIINYPINLHKKLKKITFYDCLNRIVFL